MSLVGVSSSPCWVDRLTGLARGGLAPPCVSSVHIGQVPVQQRSESGVVFLIMVLASREDMGHKIVSAVQVSQIGSGEAMRSGSTSYRAFSMRLGNRAKKLAAKANDVSVCIRSLRRCPVCRKLSHWCRR